MVPLTAPPLTSVWANAEPPRSKAPRPRRVHAMYGEERRSDVIDIHRAPCNVCFSDRTANEHPIGSLRPRPVRLFPAAREFHASPVAGSGRAWPSGARTAYARRPPRRTRMLALLFCSLACLAIEGQSESLAGRW